MSHGPVENYRALCRRRSTDQVASTLSNRQGQIWENIEDPYHFLGRALWIGGNMKP